MYKRKVTTKQEHNVRWKLQKWKKPRSKLVNCLKKGSKRNFKCKTCSEINVRRTIYNGEPKLLKEISWHSRGKPSTVSGDSRGYVGDRLPIGGPSLSDSSPLLRSFASHTWVDGPPCGSLACVSFCTPRLKGAANLALHSIAHIEQWARFCTPPAPHEAAPFVVVALASALSVVEQFWGRRLGPSPTLRNLGAPSNTPNPFQLIKNTNIA